MAAVTPDPDTVHIPLVGREDFLAEVWNYSAGEHVTIIGPTGCGKTTLAYQLLNRSTSPSLQGVVLVMKPRDETVTAWSKATGYKIIRNWPPPTLTKWATTTPSGYVVWPRTTFQLERDDEEFERVFRRVLGDCYRRGSKVIFADEVYGLSAELNLDRELVTVWSRGRSMGCGLWAATQKPTHIPLWAYSQAEHLFLHYDPDKRARERFKEIGGVDPDLLDEVVRELPRYHFLYVNRATPDHLVVVGP